MVSSEANPSTPFGTILAVKTVQARDKPAHRSYQAPGIGKHDVFEGPEAETQQNTQFGGVRDSDTAARAVRSGNHLKQRFGDTAARAGHPGG